MGAFSKQITFTPFYFKRIDLLSNKMKLTQALRYWGEGKGGRFGNNGTIQGMSIKGLKHHVALQPLALTMGLVSPSSPGLSPGVLRHALMLPGRSKPNPGTITETNNTNS